MQVFFVVDSIKEIEEKIGLIEKTFGSDIRFFVQTDLYTQICSNKEVVDKMVGVYNTNPIKKIDEYIKNYNYEIDDVLLYYSSGKITTDMLGIISKKIKYGYDSIYFTKARNKFMNFIAKIYAKVCKFVYGMTDSLCYHKLQFISKNFMGYLVKTKFNNHIMKLENSSKIELLNDEIIGSMTEKVKIKSYNIWNLIFFLTLLCGYVLCETFLDVRIYMYVGFVLFSLLSFVLGVILIVHNIFDFRYKRK